MSNLQNSLARLLKALNPNDTWIGCPACSQEWNRLRKCDFWNGSYTEQSFLCVRCAEHIPSFSWMAETYPIPGIELEIKPYAAVVSYAGLSFRIDEVPSGGDETIHFKITVSNDQENPIFKNNSLATWFWIKERVGKGEDPSIQNNSWSKFKVIRNKQR